jgi:hypothetical protein
MGKVVLTPALEAEFLGFQNPMEVCNAQGTPVGFFLPLESYKKLLANLEIPYSKEDLELRRQETEGASLQEFWQTMKEPINTRRGWIRMRV